MDRIHMHAKFSDCILPNLIGYELCSKHPLYEFLDRQELLECANEKIASRINKANVGANR